MPAATMLDKIGRAFVFEKFRDPLRSYLRKAGYETIPYAWFAVFFFFSVIVSYIAYLWFYDWANLASHFVLLQGLETAMFWLIALGVLVATLIFFFWSFLNLRIYSRTKEMEDKLPEYLSLVVTNLRSGMSFDKSLWGAIRPEFGVLAREITIVSKKVMTGNDTSDALQEFADRYDSPILRRSINLVISELESGGEIATVIERVIENLRKTSDLKKEMAASVLSYMIFIATIVIVLAPILFALANTILHVILSFASQIAGSPGGGTASGGAAGLFKTLGRLADRGDAITSDFSLFSYLALSTTAVFSGMIVSIIEKGDVRGGIKYIPVFLILTLIMFYFANQGLQLVFGSLL